MPEISQGFSDQRERHPPEVVESNPHPEGMPDLCNIFRVVNPAALFGGVVASLRSLRNPRLISVNPPGCPLRMRRLLEIELRPQPFFAAGIS